MCLARGHESGLMLRNATSRLVAIHLLLAAVTTAGVLAFLYWSTNDLVEGEVRKVVNAELAGLADEYQNHGIFGLARAIERRTSSERERDAVYLLTDALGRRLAGNLRGWPPTVEPGSGWVALELYRTDRGSPALIEAASIRLRDGERLLVGRDAEARTRFRQALLQAAWQSLGAAVLLSILTGWLLSRLVLSRISAIDRTANEIVSGNLALRVPVRGSDDEFDRVSTTLNRMLDRIEALVENLRMTTDSLAHDLRSPLMRLRAHVAELASPGLDETAREDLTARSIAEVEHLLKTFSALTQISRIEAGLGREEFAPVDLDALVTDAVELYAPVAADKSVELGSTGNAEPIDGHTQLIALALSNMLENAIRYAPEGSEIVLSLQDSADAVCLSVSDQGPGIPEPDRSRVLQRFVTLDPSRHETASGLGLALVAAVAGLHGASFKLGDNDPGLVATLSFPKRSA